MKKFLFLLVALLGVTALMMPTDMMASVSSQMIPQGWQEYVPALAFAPAIAAVANLNIAAGTPDWSMVKCVTEEQFKDLQAKHGRLYYIHVVIDETEQYHFFAKRPSRSLLSMIADYANKQDYNKINEVTIANMIVAGDKEALEDGVVFQNVMEELSKLMKMGQSFLLKV